MKINSLEDVYSALTKCRVYNESIDSSDLEEWEFENCCDRIQYVICDIELFFYGLQKINDEVTTRSHIFSMTMWDYITKRINDKKLLKFLHKQNLIVGVK